MNNNTNMNIYEFVILFQYKSCVLFSKFTTELRVRQGTIFIPVGHYFCSVAVLFCRDTNTRNVQLLSNGVTIEFRV